MHFEEYQILARKTAIYPNQGDNIIYPTLGLCGEAGEVAEKMKKVLRDSDGKIDADKREEFAKELGDVLWYLANISAELGINLDYVANKNIEKLQSRKDRNKLKGSGDNR